MKTIAEFYANDWFTYPPASRTKIKLAEHIQAAIDEAIKKGGKP